VADIARPVSDNQLACPLLLLAQSEIGITVHTYLGIGRLYLNPTLHHTVLPTSSYDCLGTLP